MSDDAPWSSRGIDDLLARAAAYWETALRLLYDARTDLFYDYISHREAERRFAHLPVPEEIARQYPNTNGWGTGMEDSTINGGVALAALCDRYEVTGEAGMAESAGCVFAGLVRCATSSAVPGMVLRSISPFDGRSHYCETSRDQLTHFAHGLWRFYGSPLADEAQRQQIRTVMTALCQRLERQIVPETGYHYCRETGDPGACDAMWQVSPHEAARLPMIYAVAAEVTGEAHWRDLCRRYLDDAYCLSAQLQPVTIGNPYALFQHQVSLEVLATVTEGEERERWIQLMHLLADAVETRETAPVAYRPRDVEEIDMDWRHWQRVNTASSWIPPSVGEILEWPAEVTDEFTALREPAELLLVQWLASGRPVVEAQWTALDVLLQPDANRLFTYAMLYPPAACWRALRNRRAMAMR